MLSASSLEWASDMLGDLLSNLHFPHFHLLLQKSSGLRGPTSPYSFPLPALIVRKKRCFTNKNTILALTLQTCLLIFMVISANFWYDYHFISGILWLWLNRQNRNGMAFH
jgi:hypothetical protein